MLRCRKIRPLLLDFSSGRLDLSDKKRVVSHLDGCAGCRGLLERERRTAAILGSLARVEARSDVWPALEAALRPAPASSGFILRWTPLRRTLTWTGTLAATAALAAVMLAPSAMGPPVRPVQGSFAEVDGLHTLAPTTAAGIGPERRSDPLLAMQDRMDDLLDTVSEQSS